MPEQSELKKFLACFRFKPELKGFVGVERERFLTSPSGLLVPRSAEFLREVKDERWTYELSACQIEDRTRPQIDLDAIKLELLENDNNGKMVAQKLGLALTTQEVGPENMPLDVYPDERYKRIASTIPRETLLAACRVTGTHLHIGVCCMSDAIKTYNTLIPYLNELCAIGDHSSGERLRVYKMMATNWEPMPYASAEQLFETAKSQGFIDNPRNCWHLIRISRHGTVELRMFGVTPHLDEIVSWISRTNEIIQGVGEGK